MSNPAAALFGLSPELLRTWPEVKQLYARVVDNAYSHPDDRETAHNVLLRLIASATDMFLKGDPQLVKTASVIMTGGKSESEPEGSEHSSQDEQNAVEDGAQTEEDNGQVHSDLNNRDDLASQLCQLGQMGQMDLSGLAGLASSITGPSLSSDELQQMFSFLTPQMLGLNVPTAPPSDGETDDEHGQNATKDGKGVQQSFHKDTQNKQTSKDSLHSELRYDDNFFEE